MRTSEKILLVFISIGILSLGSFVGFKYYEKAKTGNQAVATSQSHSSGSWVANGEEPLEVRGAPYYNSLIKRKNANLNNNIAAPGDNNSNDNFAEENFAENANQNSSDAMLAYDNATASPANLEKASHSGNSNSNQNPAPVNPENTEVKTFSFAIIGDSQGFKADDSKDSLKAAVANISKANPDLVMTEGDLVSSCDGDSKCVQKYDSWKQIMQPILSKTKEIQGNHDRIGKDDADKVWQNEFDLPANGPEGYSELTYSFDFDNSHFVVLDSEKPKEHVIGQDQRDWLEKDLSATQKDNIFVFFHEPAYPVSSKIKESLDAEPADRDALWTILKKHRVSAVFSGHEHIASRKAVDGIYQFVFGNTDAFDHDMPKPGMADYAYQGHHYAIVTVKGKQVTVKGKQVTVNVYKTDGTQLNSFVIPQ